MKILIVPSLELCLSILKSCKTLPIEPSPYPYSRPHPRPPYIIWFSMSLYLYNVHFLEARKRELEVRVYHFSFFGHVFTIFGFLAPSRFSLQIFLIIFLFLYTFGTDEVFVNADTPAVKLGNMSQLVEDAAYFPICYIHIRSHQEWI